MTDLNDEARLPSGVTLDYAGAINANGWIVGGARVGTDSSGNLAIRAFVLKPA
jgi:hypothetical protein